MKRRQLTNQQMAVPVFLSKRAEKRRLREEYKYISAAIMLLDLYEKKSRELNRKNKRPKHKG